MERIPSRRSAPPMTPAAAEAAVPRKDPPIPIGALPGAGTGPGDIGCVPVGRQAGDMPGPGPPRGAGAAARARAEETIPHAAEKARIARRCFVPSLELADAGIRPLE